MPILRATIELKSDYSNFYNILAFKSQYLVYTGLGDEITRTLTSFLFDLDFNNIKPTESKDKVKISQLFESFYDIEFSSNSNREGYTVSETRQKKRISFKLPVDYNDTIKYFKFYVILYIYKDLLFLILLKDKSNPATILNRIKTLSTSLTSHILEQPRYKNISYGFFNILNQQMINENNLSALAIMSRAQLLIFLSVFFKDQNSKDKNVIYSYYLIAGEEAIYVNIVNGRITWIYSTDIERYDVLNEFFIFKENAKGYII